MVANNPPTTQRVSHSLTTLNRASAYPAPTTTMQYAPMNEQPHVMTQQAILQQHEEMYQTTQPSGYPPAAYFAHGNVKSGIPPSATYYSQSSNNFYRQAGISYPTDNISMNKSHRHPHGNKYGGNHDEVGGSGPSDHSSGDSYLEDEDENAEDEASYSSGVQGSGQHGNFSTENSNDQIPDVTKKQRNRTASKKARERRKQWVDSVYKRKEELETLIATQEGDIERIKMEIFMLKSVEVIVDQCERTAVNTTNIVTTANLKKE